MNHPFFQDVDWERIYEKKVEPPFVPENKYPHTDGNPLPLSPVEEGRGLEDLFAGFTFVAYQVKEPGT